MREAQFPLHRVVSTAVEDPGSHHCARSHELALWTYWILILRLLAVLNQHLVRFNSYDNMAYSYSYIMGLDEVL